MARVLIFSGSTGGGHNQVAKTIKSEMEAMGHSVEISDLLTEYSRIVEFGCVRGYRFLYKHMAWLYGSIYRNTNNKFCSRLSGIVFSGLMKKSLLKKINLNEPDLIISVHPFGSGVLGRMREKKLIKCKAVALITDFTVHWAHVGKGIDRYIVASDFMKQSLIKKGVNPQEVKSAGIPIRKDFKYKNPSERDDGIFNVLIMGGSDGESFIWKSIFWVSRNPDIHITVICGKNEFLKSRLEKHYRKNKNICVKGFVTEIKPLMSKADLIVTKPGAITVTEAISQELPIVIPYAIPGHEKANAKFLVESGVAQRVHFSLWLVHVLEKMMNDPKIIDTMRNNIKDDKVKYSTDDIIESLAECIQERGA